MEPALRTGSDGSSKAIKAARAIVVGFHFPWDSDAAWQLLQHYNARYKPSWDLKDPTQRDHLRRMLREAHDFAEANGHARATFTAMGSGATSPGRPAVPPGDPGTGYWMATDGHAKHRL